MTRDAVRQDRRMPLSLGELDTLIQQWRDVAKVAAKHTDGADFDVEVMTYRTCAKELADVLALLRAQSERKFPVQNGPDIPWSIIEPFEKQCRRQHSGQTLEGLARRGGLSVCEVLSILEGGGDFDAYWTAAGRDTKDIMANILKLQAIVAGRSAVPETPAPDLQRLIAKWRAEASIEDTDGFLQRCADELAVVAASPGVRPTPTASTSSYFLSAEHCEICAPQDQRLQYHRCAAHNAEAPPSIRAWLLQQGFVPIEPGSEALGIAWGGRTGYDHINLEFHPLHRHADDQGWHVVIGWHASGTNPRMQLGICDTLEDIERTCEAVRLINGYPGPEDYR